MNDASVEEHRPDGPPFYFFPARDAIGTPGVEFSIGTA